MFITPAYAQFAQAQSSAPNIFVQLLPFVLIFVVFYFLLIRPQQKRLKTHREMVANVRRGDVVVTAGGIIGKVSRVVDDTELQVEIADGVRTRVVRGTISEVRAKSEPTSTTPRRRSTRKAADKSADKDKE